MAGGGGRARSALRRAGIVATAASTLWVAPLALAQAPAPAGDEAPAAAGDEAPAAASDGAPAAAGDGLDAEESELRERLTERPDRRRPIEPFTLRPGGHPLTLGGEIDATLVGIRDFGRDDDGRWIDRLVVESSLELEAFYTRGPAFSAFAQVDLGIEEDLLSGAPDDLSGAYVERGEMWLYSEGIAGTPFALDLGRLDYDDERTFWWDEQLDSVRLQLELDRFDVALSVGRELGPARSSDSRVAPDLEGVLRILGELGWEWRGDHAFEAFLLHQDDGSDTERVGQATRRGRLDEEDGRLTWLGARWIGASERGDGSLFGYWLDAAGVFGETTSLEFEAVSRKRLVAVSRRTRDVGGFAVDGGVIWILPWRLEPRLFAALAFGSGDGSEDSASDRAFRQTGLHSNESGFGGAERFPSYGVLLDPELSNLWIGTLGVGLSLLRSSSLDVVYHAYRQVETAPFLRDSLLDIEPRGRSPDIGHALDVVLALEEWERLEFLLIGSAFRAGDAFGRDAGRLHLGFGFTVRLGF